MRSWLWSPWHLQLCDVALSWDRWQDSLTAGASVWLFGYFPKSSTSAAGQASLEGHSAQGNSFTEAATQKLVVLYCSLDAEKIGTGACPNCSSILLHHSPNLHYCCCKFPSWSGDSYPTSGRAVSCLQLPWPGLSLHSTTRRLKYSLFCKCAARNIACFPLLESSLAEGSSCCARPLGTSGHLSCSPQRVWLLERIFKSCFQLLSPVFCSLSCLCPRNSSLKFPKLSPAWCVWHQCCRAHVLLCPQGSPGTAFCAVFVAHSIFLNHWKKIIPEGWYITKITGDLQMERHCFLSFFLLTHFGLSAYGSSQMQSWHL